MKVQTAQPARFEDLVNVRRRQDRSTQTRRLLIDAATIEFASKGFDGTTTRSIADRAKTRHALLIYHFETKQGIWRSVLEHVLQNWHTRLMAAVVPLAATDEVAALRAFQRTFIELSATEPETHWLMSHEARASTGQLQQLLETLTAKDMKLLGKLIRKAQKKGFYIAGDPAHLHYLFVGAASRVFMMSGEATRNLGRSPFDESFVERHVKYCERLFFRNLP